MFLALLACTVNTPLPDANSDNPNAESLPDHKEVPTAELDGVWLDVFDDDGEIVGAPEGRFAELAWEGDIMLVGGTFTVEDSAARKTILVQGHEDAVADYVEAFVPPRAGEPAADGAPTTERPAPGFRLNTDPEAPLLGMDARSIHIAVFDAPATADAPPYSVDSETTIYSGSVVAGYWHWYYGDELDGVNAHITPSSGDPDLRLYRQLPGYENWYLIMSSTNYDTNTDTVFHFTNYYEYNFYVGIYGYQTSTYDFEVLWFD